MTHTAIMNPSFTLPTVATPRLVPGQRSGSMGVNRNPKSTTPENPIFTFIKNNPGLVGGIVGVIVSYYIANNITAWIVDFAGASNS